MTTQTAPDPFLILSLPRCRTAWLANFLTFGGSYCYHDGLARCASPDDVAQLFSGHGTGGAHFVGNADCGQAMFTDKIFPLLAKPPAVVLIRRPVDEVVESAEAAGLDIDEQGINLLQMYLDRAARWPGVLIEDFHELDMAALRRIWTHCTRGRLPFNEARAEMLAPLQVQIMPGQMHAMIEKARPTVESLVRQFSVE